MKPTAAPEAHPPYTARRPGATAGVSLRKRRTWFAEPSEEGNAGQTGQGASDQGQNTDPLDAWVNSLPEGQRTGAKSIVEELRNTRSESKQRRLALEKMQGDQAAAEAKRLAEDKKFEELANLRGAELEKLKPVQETLTLYQQKVQKTNETRIQKISEHLRTIVPTDYDPIKLSEWLDNNEAKLTTPPAPDMDGGARGDSSKNTPKLTDEQLEAAKRMGLTPERYLKALQSQQNTQ